MKILLVGGGQIGGRHLQGIMKSQTEVQVTVVDPNERSLQTTADRVREVKESQNVISIKNINQLDDHYDLALVCTSAEIRRDVIFSLLENSKVEGLVLEKVLFQKIDEYEEVYQKLNQLSIPTWVNCPRRLMTPYVQLKKEIFNSKKINVRVIGNDWGIGCNGIHFVDIFEFITGKTISSYSISTLDQKVIESKRSGCFEFTGTMTGYTTTGDTLQLVSCSEFRQGMLVSIITEQDEWLIDEAKCKIIRYNLETSILSETVFEPQFVSDLSTIYFDNWISKRDTGLTTYSKATELHIPFLQALTNHIETVTNTEYDYCPIT